MSRLRRSPHAAAWRGWRVAVTAFRSSITASLAVLGGRTVRVGLHRGRGLRNAERSRRQDVVRSPKPRGSRRSPFGCAYPPTHQAPAPLGGVADVHGAESALADGGGRWTSVTVSSLASGTSTGLLAVFRQPDQLTEDSSRCSLERSPQSSGGAGPAAQLGRERRRPVRGDRPALRAAIRKTRPQTLAQPPRTCGPPTQPPNTAWAAEHDRGTCHPAGQRRPWP